MLGGSRSFACRQFGGDRLVRQKGCVVVLLMATLSVAAPGAVRAAGELDTTFGDNGVATYSATGGGSGMDTDATPDGGSVSTTDGSLVRLTSDGTRDAAFGTNGIVLPAAGRSPLTSSVVVNGNVVTADRQGGLSAYDETGHLVAGFGTGGVVTLQSLTFPTAAATLAAVLMIDRDPQGRILAASNDPRPGMHSVFAMRFSATGQLDLTFGTNGFTELPNWFSPFPSLTQLTGVAAAADGSMFIAGQTDALNVQVAHLTAGGAPDPTWGTNGQTVLFGANPVGFSNGFTFAGMASTSSGLVAIANGLFFPTGGGTNFIFQRGLVRLDNSGQVSSRQVTNTVEIAGSGAGDPASDSPYTGVVATANGGFITLRLADLDFNTGRENTVVEAFTSSGATQPLFFGGSVTIPNVALQSGYLDGQGRLVAGGIDVQNAITFEQLDVVRFVAGGVPAPQAYVATLPARLLESRSGLSTVDGLFNGIGLLANGTTTQLQVAGRGGVAGDASAAVLNVTVTDAAAAGFITVWPCGQDKPLASNLNYVAGSTIPNAVVTKIGPGGLVCLFNSAATHLLVDANGYFA